MGLSYDCDVLDLVHVYVISVAARGALRALFFLLQRCTHLGFV